MTQRISAFLTFVTVSTNLATADKYGLLIGADARLYPGANRSVAPSPGPGFPGTFNDGDRLAGTSDVGPTVAFVGQGTPMYDPNEFGSLSLMFRRGTVPIGGGQIVPFMGIEFLGGPLLDLDGDLNNFARSLIPVTGQTPVEIPGAYGFVGLEFDFGAGEVTLLDFDATGCNEGAPQGDPAIATILVTIAGTQPDGSKTGPINSGIDTRVGTLTAFTGNSGTLAGVYHIEDLGFELWEDTILDSPSTGPWLGTMQFLGTFQGWLVERDPSTGDFPPLAGGGLGSTRWPEVDTSQIGNTFNTANGASGGSATITNGNSKDNYTVAGNGGVALTDFGGDLGAYLDAVVAPLVRPGATRYVYLDSAGFGINNSFDPIFADTVSYDVVLFAEGGCKPCDCNCDGLVNAGDIPAFVLALTGGESGWQQAYPGCDYVCANDASGDGRVNAEDIPAFVARLTGGGD